MAQTPAYKRLIEHLKGTLYGDPVEKAFVRHNTQSFTAIRHEDHVIDGLNLEITRTQNAMRDSKKAEMPYADLKNYNQKLIEAKVHLLQKLGKG